MKRNWTIDELIDHWTLTPGEREMAKRAIGVNKGVLAQPLEKVQFKLITRGRDSKIKI